MILSKVSLHGFKSFANKINLQFDGKLTAVVGPNGCGKTNIVDAIRWGLGEQKASVLRTDRMENIIFGGAQSAKPLGMAEVSVTFDNSKGRLPIDYSEVVITRRLFRSGESEYLLNKTPVRLKDINDLLMDTGIGADCYSVIELKMIEDILSDRIEDRRKLLEEAAGVTKYKYRLRAAERKLNSTQNDLLRVNDIIQEVDRKTASLKRQLQKAKRYKVLQDEIKELELNCSRKLLAEYQERLKPLRDELKSLKEKKDGNTVEISKEEADLETLKLKLSDKEKQLISIRDQLNETVERIHHQESDIRVGKEKISSLNDRIIRFSNEISDLNKRLIAQKEHWEITYRERESYQVKITSKGRIFNNRKKELEVFQQSLNFKRLELNEKKKEIIECLEEINYLGNDEIGFRTRIDNNQGRLERIDEEDFDCRKDHENAQEVIKIESETASKLNSRKRKIVKTLEKINYEEKSYNDKISELKEQLYKHQNDLELVRGRIDFLKNIIENREGVTDGAKRLLQFKPQGLFGVLADIIETDTELRKAIETGLGDSAGYLIFNKAADAFIALGQLKEHGGGRAVLVGLDRIAKMSLPKRNISLPDKIKVIGWADELVDCDKQLKFLVNYLLGDLVIVSDMKNARKLIESVEDVRFRVATLKGELVTGWGSVHTCEAGERDGGMIGRKQRVSELEVQYKNIELEIQKEKKDSTDFIDKRISLLKRKEQNDKFLSEVQEKILKVQKIIDQAQFEREKAEQSLRANISERKNLLEEIDKAEKDLENVRPRIEKLMDKREIIENLADRVQNDVEKLEEQENIMEEEVHRLNLSLVRLKGEARNLDLEIERSEKLSKEIKTNIDNRNNEIVSFKSLIRENEKNVKENEDSVAGNFLKKESEEKKLSQIEQNYQVMKEELEVRGLEVRKVRRSKEETAEKVHNRDLDISELEHQELSLKQRIRDNYDVDLIQVRLIDDIDISNTEEKIEINKQKLKRLGVVNLMAIEEFEKENERLEFLSQQRDDLISAKDTLNETIQKINVTARKRFKDVFEVIRDNFRKTFSRFFQGGEADLRIPEGEDPLESQIEIIARPAGKHFRDLSLLSGGERALTAISLLFALYLVRPSPFCILDEIDAPLDDLNIDRFIKVLAEFAQDIQFIVVTHNKITMEAARVLYGVTMEEKGVSKIVSVKFEDSKN